MRAKPAMQAGVSAASRTGCLSADRMSATSGVRCGTDVYSAAAAPRIPATVH